MSATTCRCGKPTRDHHFVCEDCLGGFFRVLGEATWLAEELDNTITRQQRITDQPGARSTTTPLPWHEKASDARRNLHSTLARWVLWCEAEHIRARAGVTFPGDTITAMSRWLMCRIDGLALHETGPDAVEEITDAIADGMRIIDRPKPREYVGTCEDCGRDLYREGQLARCKGCGNVYNAEELRAWMNEQINAKLSLVTAREGSMLLCAFGLETKQGTIDKWHERKLLAERGHNAVGHRIYAWEDLVRLAGRFVAQGA